jgi:hypothetical protein
MRDETKDTVPRVAQGSEADPAGEDQSWRRMSAQNGEELTVLRLPTLGA